MPDRCLLYYITDRTQFGGDETERRRAMLAKIVEAARCGVDYIQLREKDLSTRELEQVAQEAMRMIHVARALGLKIMLGCMIESSVAISAAAHISPLVDYADLDGNLLISNDPFIGVGVKNGKLILNDQPGLGVSERTEG